MSTLQVSLLIVGVILLIGSFFITERLSKKEVDELSRLTSVQLQKVVDKEIDGIDDKVTDVVGAAIDKAVDELQRPMEKLSNEKIMAIHEYSDTVLEQMKKNHDETVFLYDMLNGKQDEIKDLLSSVERNKAQLREMTDQVGAMEKKSAIASFSKNKEDREEALPESAPFVSLSAPDVTEEYKESSVEEDEVFVEEDLSGRIDPGFVFRKRDDDFDYNEEDEKELLRKQIIELYNDGFSAVEIGKKLRCGVGEVKLVIDLANRGGNIEA